MHTEEELASIPLPEPTPRLIGFAEHDVRARPFKLLRTSLGKKLSNEKCNIIGVTSAAPNAGKTFTASNLAAAMSAISADRTVLVDLDLKRCEIAEIFEITERPGITEYLQDDGPSLVEIMRHVDETGLTVVPSFLSSANTAQLIAGKRFEKLISELRSYASRSIVICDLPPVLVSDDAMLAVRHLDGVLMVVEQGVTTKKQLEAVLEMIDPDKVIGSVFNRYAGSLGDPYGYGADYGKYY
ncbi:MAG: CpsD/CapB family tyrosine-protein kinase [Pseudomonadota bacterium]